MPRDITTAVATQLESSIIRPAFLVAINYPTPVYVWTGVGPLSWNGITWIGVGSFGNLSSISEASNVEAQGITLTLSGIDQTLLADNLNELNTGCLAQVYLAFFDSTGALIPDPVPAFIGLVDQPTIDLSTDKATISISVENRLVHLNRARGGRYTDQDQRARYPQDRSLRWVSCNQDIHLEWN